MFSDEARENIHLAATFELENAVKTYGEKYNSVHEGYAVLQEEIEEALDDLKYIQNNTAELWKKIKSDEEIDTSLLTVISGTALLLACEAVQISAVCEKFKRGL